MDDDEREAFKEVLKQRVLADVGGPDDGELPYDAEALETLLNEQRQRYGTEPSAAEELLNVGRSEVSQSFDKVELAAWTVVASILLNLDETITKG